MGALKFLTAISTRNIIDIMPEADFLAKRQKHYANVLNDLFDPTPHMNSIRIFEFVCALVRAGGLELGGFDPWYESKAIIDDIRNLSQLALPEEHFPEPVKTRIRLALVAYCTLTEMDLPYILIANLLRLRCGEKYHLDPFHDLARKNRPPLGWMLGTNRTIQALGCGNNLQRLAPALVCAAQMSAEHHDHFVDNQAWKLKRPIRERQHHPGPMKNHVILGSRGAMQVSNALLLVLVTESIDN